jgi:hypothetical protein
MRKIFITATFFLALAAAAQAQNTCTWSGANSTNWDSDLNWDTRPVTGNGDTVIIPGGMPRYPDTGVDGLYASLSIASGASVTFNAAMTISGNVTVAGTLNQNNIALNVGGNLDCSGTLTSTGGTITFNGSGAQAFNPGTTSTFRNITINNSGPATITASAAFSMRTLTLTRGTLNVQGFALDISGNVTQGGGILSSSGTVTLSGSFPRTADLSTSSLQNLTVSNTAGVTLQAAASLSGALSVTGTLNTGGNNLTVGGAVTAAGGTLNCGSAGTVYVAGNLTLGTLTNASGSTLALNGGGTQAVRPNGQTFGDVSISNSSTVRWTGTSYAEDISVGIGSTFRMDSSVVPGAVTLNIASGRTIANSGTFSLVSTGGTLTLQGNGGNATFTGNNVAWDANDITMGNLVYNAASAPTLANGTVVTLNGPVTFSDGVATVAGSTIAVNTRTLTLSAASSNAGTLSASTGTITAGANSLTNTGSLTFTAAGSLTCGAVTNSGTITLAGGAVGSGSVDNSGTIVFGTAAGATWTAGGYFTSTAASAITNTNTNTVTVSGNVSILGGFGNPGNSLLRMDTASTYINAAPQIGSLTLVSGATGVYLVTNDLNLSGALTVPSGTSLTDATNDRGITVAGTTTVGGTLTLGGSADSFGAIGGLGTLNDESTDASPTSIGGNLTVGTFNPNGGTVRFTGGSTGAYGFNNVVIAGTVSSTGAWTIAGNLTISGGAWTAGSYTHRIAGNWTNNVGTAGFAGAGSTIRFTGNGTHLVGGTQNTSFNNLTVSETGGAVCTFTAGRTITVSGLLTLTGDKGNLITVESSSSGSTWSLNNTGTNSVSFVRVSDSPATTASVNAANSISLTGNNTNWVFGAVSWAGTTTDANAAANWATGVVPGQYDSATIPPNGTLVGTVTVTSQPVQTAAMSLRNLTIQGSASWGTGGQDLAVSSTLDNSGTFTGTGAGTLTVPTLTNSGACTYGGSGTLAVSTALTNTGSFTHGGSGSLSVSNSLNSSGTITYSGSGSFTLTGITSVGGLFVYSTVDRSMISGLATYNNLELSAATITAIAATVNGSTTVDGGATFNIGVAFSGGTVVNDGTLGLTGTLTSGTFTNNGAFTTSGTLNCTDFTSSGSITNSAANNIYASGDVGISGATFSNPANSTLTLTGGDTALSSTPGLGTLVLNKGSTTATVTNGASLTLSGALTLTEGILDIGSTDLIVAGNITRGPTNPGHIASSATMGTITLNGGGAQTANFTASTIPNLTVNNSNGVTLNNTAAFTWNGGCHIQAGTLTLAGYSQTIGAVSGYVYGGSGTLDADAISGTLTVNGYVGTTGNALGTLRAPTSGTVNVGTDWNVTSFVVTTASTVAFTGTGTIYSGTAFHSLAKTTGGTTTLNTSVTATNTAAVSGGILALENNDLGITSSLTLSGGELTHGTGTLSCASMTVSGGTYTGTGAGALILGGVLNASSGSLNLGAKTVTGVTDFGLSGTAASDLGTATVAMSGNLGFTSSGIHTAGSSVITMAGGNIDIGSVGLSGTVIVNGASVLQSENAAVDIQTLRIGSGSLTVNTGLALGVTALQLRGAGDLSAAGTASITVGATGVDWNGTTTADISMGTGALTVNGPFTQTATAYGSVSVGSGGMGVSGVVTNYGTITLTAGNFSATGAAANANYGTIRTLTSGTQSYAGAVTNSGTITGAGLVTFSSGVTSGGTYNNGVGGLFCSGAAAFSGSVNGYATADPSLEFTGNLNMTGATLNLQGDSIVFSGGNAQTFTTGGLTGYAGISVNKTTATTVTTSGSLTATSLTIPSGTFAVATATTMTVSGVVSVTDTLNLNGTATLALTGDLTLGTLSAATTSTVRFNGGASQTVRPNGQTFGIVDVATANTEVRWTGTATTRNIGIGASTSFYMDSSVVPGAVTLNVASGSTITNNGAFYLVSSGGTLTLQGTAASATFTGNNISWDVNDVTMGNLIYNASAAPALASGTVVTLNNPVTFSDGITTVGGSTIDANSRTLTLGAASSNAGVLSVTTGTIAAGANSLTNTNAITFTGAGSLTCGALTNNAGGTITLAGGTVNTGAVTNSGSIVFGTANGAAWSAAAFSSSGAITNTYVNAITASGNVTISGTFSDTANSTLVMTGGGTTLGASIPLGHFTVNSGGTVTLASACEFDGNIAISSGYLASGNYNVTANANWTDSVGNHFTPGTCTVEFTYDGALVIGDNQWYNLLYRQAGGTLRFQRSRTQSFLAGGTFTATGTTAQHVRLTRDNPLDDGLDLDWVAGTAPDATLMWQLSKPGTAFTDFDYVDVYYCDARAYPIQYSSAYVTLGTVGTDNNPVGEQGLTCYAWFSGMSALYSYTEDEDSDGRIDRIKVTAQGALNMNFSDLAVTVTGYEIDTAKGTNGFSGTVGDDSFYIYLVEKKYLDGSRTPNWTITYNTQLFSNDIYQYPLTLDLADPLIPADTVPPRIAYTLTVPNTAATFFAFNEPVAGSGAGGAVTASDMNSSAVNTVGLLGDGDVYGVVADYGVRSLSDIALETTVTVDSSISDNAAALYDWSTDPVQSAYISTAPSYPAGSPPNHLTLTSATHRVSDLAISVPPNATFPSSYFVWPVWAKDETDFDPEAAGFINWAALSEDQAATLTIGFIRGFDGTRWLRDQHIDLQAEDGLGLEDSPSIFYKSDVDDAYRSAVPGIWLPDYNETSFSGLAAIPFSGYHTPVLTGTPAPAPLWDYELEAANVDIYDGAEFEFYFRLNNGYPDDLYCGRLDMDAAATTLPADWYLRVRPFGFEIHDVATQRGGVSILNNVIDPTTGERSRLHFTLAKAGPVTVTVFTLDGDVVRSLQRGTMSPGDYTVSWDGRNRSGDPVARGMYFIRIVAPGIDEIRKVMVVRY